MNNETPTEDFSDDSLNLEDDNDDSFNFDDYDTGGQPPISKYSDLLKELTNFDPLIQSRIRNWLGLEWDEKIQDYTQKQTAIINERGARWAIGCLQVYQAKTNIITNLGREEYINMKLEIIDLAWVVFGTKYDEFNIKDAADQYRISNELQHSAFLVLAGAGDGKYTKFLGQTHSVHENISMQPMNNNNSGSRQSNSGFLDGIKSKLLGRN